jgi:hypothetical protein
LEVRPATTAGTGKILPGQTNVAFSVYNFVIADEHGQQGDIATNINGYDYSDAAQQGARVWDFALGRSCVPLPAGTQCVDKESDVGVGMSVRILVISLPGAINSSSAKSIISVSRDDEFAIYSPSLTDNYCGRGAEYRRINILSAHRK